MEDKIVVLFILVLMTTACTDNQSSKEGIITEEFTISDSELRPNQETILETTIVNYNDKETSLKSENIELFNTGQLKVNDKQCTPDEIGASTQDLNPKINCRWNIQAPSEEFIEGFSSKTIPLNLMYSYETVLESDDPMTVKVSESAAESGTSEIEKKFSNNDIEIALQTINPVPLEGSREFEAEVSSIGSGSLNGNYGFGYDPEELFSNCPDKLEPIDGETRFSCKIDSEVKGSQKVFFSTSYKYQRVHNKVIEVVGN